MADLTNVDKIQAATEEGNIKWYVDNDSAGSWRRASFEDYKLDLFDSKSLTVAIQGSILFAVNEGLEALLAAIDASLEAKVQAKLTAFSEAVGKLYTGEKLNPTLAAKVSAVKLGA